jgi:hypothetical protein
MKYVAGLQFHSLFLAGVNLLPRHPCSESPHQDVMTDLKSAAFSIIYLRNTVHIFNHWVSMLVMAGTCGEWWDPVWTGSRWSKECDSSHYSEIQLPNKLACGKQLQHIFWDTYFLRSCILRGGIICRWILHRFLSYQWWCFNCWDVTLHDQRCNPKIKILLNMANINLHSTHFIYGVKYML